MPLLSAATGDYPAQYNAFLTTTTQKYQPTLVDNISHATPALWWLNQKGRKKKQVGGESIVQPLMYALPNVQRFTGYDNLDTDPHEGIAPAVFLWKHMTVPIVISKAELRGNQGEAAVLNLLDAQLKKAEIGLADALNYDICQNGIDGVSVTGYDARGVDGLPMILQNSTQANVYGGISAASGSYTWWANTHDAISTDFNIDGIQSMRSAYLTASRGQDHPDLLLCAQDFYENYDQTLIANKRYVNTLAADAGFENLAYRGAVMMYDPDVTDGYCYLLNSKYLQLIVDPAVDFYMSEWSDADKTPDGQWAIFCRIFWRGNLTCSNRKRQAMVTGGSTYDST